MNKLTGVCLLIALASPALHAQRVEEPSSGAQSHYNIEQDMLRMQQERVGATAEEDRRATRNALADLTKLRAKLAEAWQALGLDPQAARAVAAAYQPNAALNAHRASLRGKSDEEVAALLQASLAKKDYQLANQTLIDYERDRLKLGTDLSPNGQR